MQRAACTGENEVKSKRRTLCPIYSTSKCIINRSKCNVLIMHDLAVHMENVKANRRRPLRT